MGKVSIVIPIYNAEKTLDKCIKSVLRQTFKDFELILVNDGSKDDSLKICKKYQATDQRVIIVNEANEGCIAARMKGVKAANCEYLMFVDSDDWVDRKAVEIIYNEAMAGSVDVTVCNMYKVLGNGLFVRKKNRSLYFSGDRLYYKDEIKRNLVVAYFHGHPFPSSLFAKLYKKELLLNSGKYLDRIHFLGEDLYYNLEIFLKANTVKVIDKPLYYYRLGGFTSKYMPYLFEDMIHGYQIQKEVINEYYLDTQQKHYNGISIMLLNTFKTCLYNLFNSELSDYEIRNLIRKYALNETVVETLSNSGSKRHFSREYLDAIRNKDIQFLYELGQSTYRKQKPKKALIRIISKFL
jgi:glycosyltransferase involved in cell wall biosynthesis